jgi:hypothetical protein
MTQGAQPTSCVPPRLQTSCRSAPHPSGAASRSPQAPCTQSGSQQ